MAWVNSFIFMIIIPLAFEAPNSGMAQITRKFQASVSRQGYHLRGNVRSVLQKSVQIRNEGENFKTKKQRLILKSTSRITFNEKGELIARECSKKGKPNKTEKFIYFKNGNLARKIVHSGKISKQYWYIYNPRGDLIEMKLRIGNWMIKDRRYFGSGITATYNLNGKLTELDITKNLGEGYRVKKIYGPDRKIRKEWSFKLNSKARIVQKIYYAKTGNRAFVKLRLVYSKRFFYNPEGDLERAVKYHQGNLTAARNFRYTYDSHRNWVKKIIARKGRRVKIVKRRIVYY
jgi:antitoxin component YwqK of YwqJK toxin-antitoxin module